MANKNYVKGVARMNRNLSQVCLEFMYRNQDSSGLCEGCNIFTKKGICPLYCKHDSVPVAQESHALQDGTFDSSSCYDSPETNKGLLAKSGDSKNSLGCKSLKVSPDKPLDTYSFSTACPDRFYLGVMGLFEEEFDEK